MALFTIFFSCLMPRPSSRPPRGSANNRIHIEIVLDHPMPGEAFQRRHREWAFAFCNGAALSWRFWRNSRHQLRFSRTTRAKRGPWNACRHFEWVTYAPELAHTLAFVLPSTGCFDSQTAGEEREIQNITSRWNSRRAPRRQPSNWFCRLNGKVCRTETTNATCQDGCSQPRFVSTKNKSEDHSPASIPKGG